MIKYINFTTSSSSNNKIVRGKREKQNFLNTYLIQLIQNNLPHSSIFKNFLGVDRAKLLL